MEINLSTDINNISWEDLARVFELAPLGKKRDPEKLEMRFETAY